MKLTLSLGIQFMMKDRVMDMPKMLSQQKHEYPFEVSIPMELEPFVTDYAIAAQTGAAAKYESPKIAAQMWRPKVRTKYPEMFKTIDQEGKTVKFNVSDDNIIDAAICMNVEDVIDKFIDENKDKIIDDLKLERPNETETHYFADTFIHLLEWHIIFEEANAEEKA